MRKFNWIALVLTVFAISPRAGYSKGTIPFLRPGIGITIGDLPMDWISGPAPAQWRLNTAIVGALDVRPLSSLGGRVYLGLTIPPKNSNEVSVMVGGIDAELYLLVLGEPPLFELAFIAGTSNLLNTTTGNHNMRLHLGGRTNFYLGQSFFLSTMFRTNLTYMGFEGGFGLVL